MTPLQTATILTLTFATSLGGTGLFKKYALKSGLLDIASHRSSHVGSVPRGGGAVFASLWIFATIVLTLFGAVSWRDTLALVPGAILTAAIGFGDDHVSLSAKSRIITHFLAASVCVFFSGGVTIFDFGLFQAHLEAAGSLLVVWIMAWSINLFNFMDGTDGFAATEASFVFAGGGAMLATAGEPGLALLCWILAAATGGFLFWNRPKAKIFMGDVGSGFLGYLVAAFAFIGEKRSGVPALCWLILYGVFFFDSTVTLLRRFIAKHDLGEPHRLHAFQRLCRAGWSHGRVLTGLVVLNCLAIALAWFANTHRTLLPVVALGFALILTAAYVFAEKVNPMFLRR